MCCPGLKHLNLSSCLNITDAAFAVPNSESNTSETASANTGSATHSSHPGCNLTSVDISGCQALSTVAVKNLVAICGANLTSINLAWTGVSCTALLYLAGLNMDQVGRLMHETDPASRGSLQPSDNVKWDLPPISSECKSMLKARHDNQTGWQEQDSVTCGEDRVHDLPVVANCSELFQNVTKDSVVSLLCLSSTSPVGEELPIDPCESGSQLNEDELVTCKSLAAEDLQHFTESSDEESDDSFKTASDEIEPCFPSEEDKSFPASVQNNSKHEEPLEIQERCRHDACGHSDVMKFDEVRELCWSVTTEKDSTSKKSEMEENSCEKVCSSGEIGTLLSCVQVETCSELHSQKMVGSEYHVKRTPATFLHCFEPVKEELTTEEKYETWFDCTENQPAMSFEDRSLKGSQIVHQCALEMSSLEKDCDNAVATNARNKPEYSTMPCEGVRDEEFQKCYNAECPVLHPVRLDLKETDCPSLPCKEVIDEEQEMSQCGEPVCHVYMDAEETDNYCCYSDLPCNVVKDQKPLTWTVMPHQNVNSNGMDCYGDDVTLPDVPFEEEINRQISKLSLMCADAEESRNSKSLSSGKRVIQFGDLAQAQMYQPKITSLDITNIFYQSQPLGVVCLKVFSKACKCLKHFAVSWSELDDDVLMYLLKKEPDLESLSLVCFLVQLGNLLLLHVFYTTKLQVVNLYILF